MTESIQTIGTFGRLPLYTGIQQSPNMPNVRPAFLAFALGFSGLTERVVQVANSEVERALEKAYLSERICLTSPIDESPLTRWRGDEFTRVLSETADLVLKDKQLLEIGCSTGYILNELRAKGSKVRGCEPGPSALTARARYGLDVENGFFKPNCYDRKFDVVVHLTVLEHVQDPVIFLAQTAAVLKPGGLTFLGVPDCERQLNRGDPGMILHEHWSYFTSRSLTRTLRKAGFADVRSYSSQHGVLYAWGRWNGSPHVEGTPSEASELSEAVGYVKRFHRGLTMVDQWLQEARCRQLRVGLYGASVGAANLLALVDWDGTSVHLYDGDPVKLGGFLPGCGLAVRSPNAILEDRLDKLLILPITFTESIYVFLRRELCVPASTQIDSLQEWLRAEDRVTDRC